MENSKISPHQLFSLIVLFELGTALIVPLGVEAKQDAWLAELLGLTGGIVLMLQYYYLYNRYPNLLLTSYIQKILGIYLGNIIALSYILFFIYGASRDLRESSELFMIAYTNTPMIVMSTIMMILVCYALHHGIEVIARTGELFIVLVISMVILAIFFVIGSNLFKIENLMPVLENGWGPVLTTAFPNRVFFPYGELICFTVIFPYLNKPKQGMKFGMVATILSGLILIITIVIEIAVLGVHELSNTVFPFLRMVEKIHIGGFIQSLEGLAMFVLIIGDFFKVTVFSYAAVICATNLLKVKNHRKLVLPIGGIILVTSMVATVNFVEHGEQGKMVLRSVFPLFEFVIPLLLIVIAFIQQQIRNKSNY